MAAKQRRIVWKPEEWAKILLFAVPLAHQSDMTLHAAMDKAQRKLLTRDRWRERHVLRTGITRGHHLQYVAMVDGMTDAQRQAVLDTFPRPAQKKPPKPTHPDLTPNQLRAAKQAGMTPEDYMRRKAHKPPGIQVHWTQREWAVIAREIDRMAAEGDTRNDGARLFDAQDKLDPDRRRSWSGVGQTVWGHHDRWLKNLDAGRAYVWTLEAAEDKAAAAAATIADAETKLDDTPAEPAARMVTEFINDPAPYTAPSGDRVAQLSGALAQVFAVLFAPNHEQHAAVMRAAAAMERAAEKMERAADEFSRQTATTIARDIRDNLGGVVHQLLEAELGPMTPPTAGPVPGVPKVADSSTTPPPKPLELAPIEGDDEHPQQINGHHEDDDDPHNSRPPRMPVDVVGLIGSQVSVVREEFKDLPWIDLRFIEANHVQRAGFRRNVVAVIKFCDKVAAQRAEQAGSNVVWAYGAARSVIEAVNSLRGETAGIH